MSKMGECSLRAGLINDEDSEKGFWQIFTFHDLVRPCVAELVSVALFVFVGSLSAQTGSPLGVAFAHGLTIAILVAGLGHISGAHINPSVTLAVSLAGGMHPLVSVFYVISQLIGSLIGAACCLGVLSYNQMRNVSAFALINGGAPVLGPGVGEGHAFFCEVMLTLILSFTVLMTAVDTKGKSVIAPLAIGFSLVAAILAGGKVSGAVLNPARAFGPTAIVSIFKPSAWKSHYIYWVGPSCGSMLAAFLFRIFFADSDRRMIFKED